VTGVQTCALPISIPTMGISATINCTATDEICSIRTLLLYDANGYFVYLIIETLLVRKGCTG
jgi:hypothetical protein